MTTYGFRDIYNNTFYFAYLSHINQEQLIIGKYYINGKEGCYEYLGTSEIEESSATFDYQGGPFDDSVCSVVSNYAHHFIVGCNETDLWVTSGDFTIDNLWYQSEYDDPSSKTHDTVTGCVKYIGYEEHEPDLYDSTYLNYISIGFEDCTCSGGGKFLHKFDACGCGKPGQLQFYEDFDFLNEEQLPHNLVLNEWYSTPDGTCCKYLGLVEYTTQQYSETIELYAAYGQGDYAHGFATCECLKNCIVYIFERTTNKDGECFGTGEIFNVRQNEWLFPSDGDHYLYKDNCYVYVETKEMNCEDAHEVTEEDFTGPFVDCDCVEKPVEKYMLFETCDGTLKYWREYNPYMEDLVVDEYYSFGDAAIFFDYNPDDFPPDVDFNTLINSDKVRVYANCFRFIGYVTEQPNYHKYPFQITKSGACSEKSHNKNNQYCEMFFESIVSTCSGTEEHVNISHAIINLLHENGYVTFKWNNKCYYILEILGEENLELQFMDIEHLNDIYPGCTECKNDDDDNNRRDNTEYYEKVNCEFADAVYNKAMSDRYGVEFCCEKDLQRLTIKKKLLDAGALQDDIDLCEI